MKIYIVDVILYDKEPSTRKSIELIVVGSMQLFPEALVLIMDRIRERLRIGGQARLILQGNIMRKFLNYNDSVRVTILESDLIMAITGDCPDVVKKALLTVISLTKNIELLFLLLLYQFGLTVFKDKGKWDAQSILCILVPTFVFPFLMYTFFRKRERHTTLTLLKRDRARNNLSRTVERIVRNVRLILDMAQRNAVIKDCVDAIEHLNKCIIRADSCNAINRSFAPILTDCLSATFLIAGGHLVLLGKISLGQFLTNLAVYQQARRCWSNIYGDVLTVNDALPCLEQVCRHLNLPIDLEMRRLMVNSAREMNAAVREKAMATLKAQRDSGQPVSMYPVDTIPLKLCNVCFYYTALSYGMTVQGMLDLECKGDDLSMHRQNSKTSTGKVAGMTRSSLETEDCDMSWSLTIPQGSIFALIGKHGDGKSTLLKLIGGVLLPVSGEYFVPPQLRVCFVSHSPILFHASLLDNLWFGLDAERKKEPGQLDRIKGICRKLTVSEAILDTLESREVKDFNLLLSSSQLKKFHIARAFIANPELLVFDRPIAGFDLKTGDEAMNAMKEHIRCKGLCESSVDTHLRRPRTIVFSTDRPEPCTIADFIYVIRRKAVREVSHSEITDDLLYVDDTKDKEFICT
jgi:ABC-type multidrug transport system fused ATPase/permease subunit